MFTDVQFIPVAPSFHIGTKNLGSNSLPSRKDSSVSKQTFRQTGLRIEGLQY